MESQLLDKGHRIIESCTTQSQLDNALKWVELAAKLDYETGIFLTLRIERVAMRISHKLHPNNDISFKSSLLRHSLEFTNKRC